MRRTTNHYRKGSFGARFRSHLAAQTRRQNALELSSADLPDATYYRKLRALDLRGRSTCTALTIYEPPLEFKPAAAPATPAAPQLVDWLQPQLLPRPNNPKRRERFYPVYCPECKTTRLLRAFDARRVERGERQVCASCQSSAAGSKGYAATRALYGDKWSVECLRDYLLDHPRPTMQAVIDILDELGIDYEREYWLETLTGKVFLIDAVLPGKKAIEADGTYVHSLDKQRADDDRKRTYLRSRGYELLVVTDQDVAQGKAFDMIRVYAGLPGLREDPLFAEDSLVTYEQLPIPF